MSLNSTLSSVRSYLASHYMYVENEWLFGCVEYLIENSGNNLSEIDIKSLAREQWLLNDLKDICPGCLPGNLTGQLKTVLNGRFVLQINAAVDIGTPAYQQYLKLQKVNMENVDATTKHDDKVPSHRMIKLYLTDGVQEISAIEYKPMRNLSCDITPGCKVLVKGPIECRRGVLLLSESSIELLGGEVSEIAVSNSLAGMLSCQLGLPMVQETDRNTTNSNPRNNDIPTPHTEIPSALPPDTQLVPILDHNSRPVARVTSIQVANFNDDDIDIEQLNAVEAQIDNPGKRTLTDAQPKPEKKMKIDLINAADDYPNDIDLLIEEDEEYLREIESRIDSHNEPKPITVPSEPYVFIKQITDLTDSDRAGRVFKVKAQIMKLLSKLTVGKEGWSLRCTIVDGTGSIDVDFTSGVLSKLVGFTPQEMNQLKKEMSMKPELKAKAVSALQKAKDTLQVLYCIVELTMLEVPKITGLTPFEEAHVDLLKRRTQNTRL